MIKTQGRPLKGKTSSRGRKGLKLLPFQCVKASHYHPSIHLFRLASDSILLQAIPYTHNLITTIKDAFIYFYFFFFVVWSPERDAAGAQVNQLCLRTVSEFQMQWPW